MIIDVLLIFGLCIDFNNGWVLDVSGSLGYLDIVYMLLGIVNFLFGFDMFLMFLLGFVS